MWTATNNSKSGDDPEAFRSLFLAFQDVLGMVTKDGKFSIGNNAVRFGVLSDRLLENTINLFNELNSETLNGMVRKALILDIVADFSTILDMVSNVFKLSPIGILFNVTSIFVTAISNEMNSDGITSENELMPRDEIFNIFGRSALDVISKWSDVVAPITSTLLSFMPDDLNPWSSVTIDLVGTKLGDNIVGDEDRKYNIWGHNGSDTLTGGRFNDYIDGGADNDFLYGGKGNDVLVGGEGSDELYGGEGDDVLIVSKFEFGNSTDINLNNLDTVGNKAYGGKGNDQIFGGNGNDELYAGDVANDQNDVGTVNILYGLGGSDYLYGGAGSDTLYGGLGEDRLYGGDGDDNLYLAQNSNPDQVALDTSNNFAEGGAGNDLIHGSDGDDIIFTAEDGNGGIDAGTENYAWGYKGRDILKGGDGVDYLYGGDGTDSLHGGKGNDKLYGGQDNDHLYGEDDDDELYAGRIKYDTLDSGNNFLYGGKGDDTLYGGAGHDVLVGGEGFDIYKAYGETLIDDREGDGKGKIFYHDRELMGARITYESDSLAPPPISSLDFSHKGYELKDLGFVGFSEIAGTRTEKSVSYIVTGKIDFTYKELTTEGVGTRNFSDTDLGVRFIVTVHKDKEPPPPPNIPPNNPPTRSDPLILDLDHDGKINTKSLNQGVNFDLDGNEFAEKTSWVAPQDGFVVLDLNDNGKIDNGGELFGTDTLLANGNKAIDGFQALAQYDEN